MREKILEFIFIVLAIVFAAGGYGFHKLADGGYHPAARQPDDLRIVTWNVGGTGGYGGRSLNNKYLPHIAAVLKKLNADLIMLQEIASAHQAQRLSRILDGNWEVIVSTEGSSLLAILGQRGGLQIQPRLTQSFRTLAASYHLTGLRSVLLMNIHADPYSAKERNTLIGQVTDVLMSQDSDYLRILAGDLNLDVDIDKRRDLFSDNEHLDVETYNYLVQRLSDLTRNTGSTAEPDRRLDYIFADYEQVSVRRAGPWKGQRVADMDHDPVVADLQIKNNP
jgi:endonuclease/exonuclease/phosphatase family metal-dependent hydrolase